MYKIAIAIIATVSASPAAYKAPTMCSITYPEAPGLKHIGFCTSTKRCANAAGYSTPGFCPGGADNQCCSFANNDTDAFPEVCIVPRENFFDAGICTGTKACKTAGGFSTKGYCPGGNDIQCCRNNY